MADERTDSYGPYQYAPYQHPPYQPRPPRRGWVPWVVLAVLALVVGVAVPVAVLVQSSGGGRDPEEALAAAQALVEDASSYEFTLEVEDTFQLDSSSTTSTYTGEGEWAEDAWRLVLDDGYFVTETVLDGDTAYDRRVDSGDDPAEEMWTLWEDVTLSRNLFLDQIETMADEELGTATSLAASIYLGDVDSSLATSSISFGGDPAGFLLAIGEISAPAVEEGPDDELTLSDTLQVPAEFEDAFGSELPDGRVELDLDADDVPTTLRLEVEDGDGAMQVTIELSDWNGEVDFETPDEDEIDETPLVGEDDVRDAAAEVDIVVPTAIPDGWVLSMLDVVSADLAMDTSGDRSLEDCTVVEVDWEEDVPLSASDEEWESRDYVYLWLMTADCALRAEQTPFVPGGPGGLPSRENEYYELLEVQVGETVVQVDTTLDDAEIGPILASLAAADVEALIEEATEAAGG